MPSIDAYRRMLDEFSPLKRNLPGRWDPDTSQIIAILKAAKYPE
jgi:hypothetical protein